MLPSMFMRRAPRPTTDRRARRLLCVIAAITILFVGAPSVPTAEAQSNASASDVNNALGVGVNLGNALEGPREGDWGMTIEDEFFGLIAEAGFGHVRVPIKFSAYAETSAPYTIPTGIDPRVRNADNLWQRIDHIIAQAEANNLYVIIDLHHYDEIHADVAGHRDRFLSMWDQIATRYANAGSRVLFELLNEPNSQFSDNPALLNDLLADGLAVVRQTNPSRPVLVGPASYNSIRDLDALQLPNDPNLIVSVHYYEPFDFTHQGATWVGEIPPAPAFWDADLAGFGAGWQDWSWETTATPASGGLDVQFGRQWAGLQFADPTSSVDPSQLTVRIDGQSELSVRCANIDGGAAAAEMARIFTVRGGSTHTVDMSACPADTGLIIFQMASATYDRLTVGPGEVCEFDGTCSALVATAAEALQTDLDAAQAWGEANNRPMNIGEFGVYGADGLADLGERAEWTAAVRDGAIARGMSATYWEFGAGFGVYDRQAGDWVQPLLTALDPAGALPNGPVLPTFACASDAGTLTWTNHNTSPYWTYKSTDGGNTYQWLGKTNGATTLTDPNPANGTQYQVHYQGIPRATCTITAEPTGPGLAPFACASDAGTLTWTNHNTAPYWTYKSTDGGNTYQWLGKTNGATTLTDPNPANGTQYQVHYQGIPRANCTITAEPTGGGGSNGPNAEAHLQSILDNPTRNTIFDDNPFRDVPMDQLQVSDLAVNGDLYNETLLNAEQNGAGYFRVKCEFSHFAYDDPIVFPNEPNRTHLHMFFGNTEANAFSTFDSLRDTGTGTCNGEDLNRTAYWVPALLDSSGHALIPFEIMVYYKNDSFRVDGANELVGPFPDNLQMVVGNAMATQPQNTLSGGFGSQPIVQFACGPAYNSREFYGPLLPDCYGTGNGAYGDNGRALEMQISFPQCYDPNSDTYTTDGSHMSYSEGGYYGIRCPASHPYDVSSIMYRIFFSPDDYGGSLANLRLSSDVRMDGQILPGGTTAHADWFGAWHPETMALWVQNCNNLTVDCEIGLLGRDPLVSLVPRKEYGIGSGYRATPWDILEMCPGKEFDAGDPLRSVANCRTGM